jgi:Flp pilus assembly protein TadD
MTFEPFESCSMSGEPEVLELLEQLLDSGKTPEEVCHDRPDLLPELRKRWREFRLIDAEFGAMLPEPATRPELAPKFQSSVDGLPQIPGYDVESILGRGGMGVVYKARQRTLDRPVAIKMLLAGAFADPQELARFRREAESLAVLRHPNIVQVYDAGEVGGHPFFTMELVEGGSLARHLSATPQAPDRAATLAAVLAGAVQFAHRSGVVHRDLKPANILLTKDGTPKITDFGLAMSVGDGTRYTISGARIGTPGYMAPEQALGKASALGPAVDIYALGAVLYELLTGRPPFVGETPVETERQVIADEPVPPSRLNAKVPRDLETICLKCLNKNPVRRYASAQDLADDLHRFLDGAPVLARPVGLFERGTKWVRRRPATATLLTALVVLLAVIVWVSVDKHQQDLRTQRAIDAQQQRSKDKIEALVAKAYETGRARLWEAAERTLGEAAGQLPEADDNEIREKVTRAQRDVRFARRLCYVRQQYAAKNLEPYFVMASSPVTSAELYEKAFAEEKFDFRDESSTVAHIRAGPLADETVAAIDSYALAAFLLKQEPLQQRLLRIARIADPDPPWRDRLRDPKNWRDKDALVALEQDCAKVPKQPAAHQLAMVGALLRNLGEQSHESRLLRAAISISPSDFWLNWELAEAFGREQNHAEAAKYWRIVNALSPGDPEVLNRLGVELAQSGEFDDAAVLLSQAAALSPNSGWLRHNAVRALLSAGRASDAEAYCQKAIATHPKDSFGYHALGLVRFHEKRFEAAITPFRQAIALKPSDVGAHGNLARVLELAGHDDDAVGVYREIIGLKPTQMEAHQGLARIFEKSGRYEEAVSELQWIISARQPDKQNGDFGDYLRAQRSLLSSLLSLGRFAEAGRVAREVLSTMGLDDQTRESVKRQLEIAEKLLALGPNSSAIDPGIKQSADVATQCAIAEWYYRYRKCPAASAQSYELLFAAKPALAGDLRSRQRFYAACAAAQAGCGVGRDIDKLDTKERQSLRRKALERLSSELVDWEKRYVSSRGAERAAAAQTVSEWQTSEELACVRGDSALSQLPDEERQAWREFWKRVKPLASRDPALPAVQARQYVDQKQWAKAARIYEELTEQATPPDGEIWFERAASQLLAGDREGYRQSCRRVLELASKGRMRAYLAARACSLAPDSVDDPIIPADIGDFELKAFPQAFWSLTEQGALQYRLQRYDQAVSLFELSLKSRSEPGCAVLNWLWLALAQQRRGDKSQARAWLQRATTWLDALTKQMPGKEVTQMHRHNWLEAQVLRKEAEALLGPPSQ